MSEITMRSKRDDDATAQVRTTFLPSGAESAVHAHDEHTTWTHVVSGEIVEDRWTRVGNDDFVHERRSLRGGQSMAAPGRVLHRVRALGDAVFITTCACGCAEADSADVAEIHAAQRKPRSGIHHAWSTQTMPGEQAPE